jgi:2,4-dienoyl-CoA reductase-like NADH-dependent reductase (Old Yellow Enzyme family)
VAAALKAAGIAYVCVSSGGNSAAAKPPLGPGYMVPLAERIKREIGVVTRAVGMITEPDAAEAIVAGGKADLVAFARAVLADPRWPWRAAVRLGQPLKPVHQYARSAPVLENWVKQA